MTEDKKRFVENTQILSEIQDEESRLKAYELLMDYCAIHKVNFENAVDAFQKVLQKDLKTSSNDISKSIAKAVEATENLAKAIRAINSKQIVKKPNYKEPNNRFLSRNTRMNNFRRNNYKRRK